MKSPGTKLFLMKQNKGEKNRIKKTKDMNYVDQFWCVPYGFIGKFLKLRLQTADQSTLFHDFYLQSPRKMGLTLELWKHPSDISNLASSTFHYLDMWATYFQCFSKYGPETTSWASPWSACLKLAILKPHPRSRESESVQRNLGISILKQSPQAIFYTPGFENHCFWSYRKFFSFPDNHWGSLLQLSACPAWSQVCFKGILPYHASISFLTWE